jgi:hypothetical protein
MSDRETEALVTREFPWLADHQLNVVEVDDYPGLRYVTILDEDGEPLIGGPAYVVSLEAEQVVKVSASRPPRANMEEAQQRIYEVGGGTETVS